MKRVKPYFGMPTWPGYYSWNLLKETGIGSPPVPIEPIAELLKLKVRYFPPFEHLDFDCDDDEVISSSPPASAPLFDDSPYWKQKTVIGGLSGKKRKRLDGLLKNRTVWIDGDKPYTRQRMTFGHECGHEVIPSHKGLSYLDHGCLIDPSLTNRFEREANAFGANLLMPAPWFFEDAHSVGMSLDSIEFVARHYQTSLEATAIQYVRFNLYPCAIVIAEPNPDFPLNTWDYPVIIRYSMRNSAFQDYIAPGTEIPHGTPLVSASIAKTSIKCKVTGWELGLRVDRRYLLDCKPWGTDGDVIALVWQIPEGEQKRLFRIQNHIYGSGNYRSSLVVATRNLEKVPASLTV
jgi:hypothetical protein